MFLTNHSRSLFSSLKLKNNFKRYFTNKFQIKKDFLSLYLNEKEKKIPPFGFNGLGELVYMRTYSRVNEQNEKETWGQTIERVLFF